MQDLKTCINAFALAVEIFFLTVCQLETKPIIKKGGKKTTKPFFSRNVTIFDN